MPLTVRVYLHSNFCDWLRKTCVMQQNAVASFLGHLVDKHETNQMFSSRTSTLSPALPTHHSNHKPSSESHSIRLQQTCTAAVTSTLSPALPTHHSNHKPSSESHSIRSQQTCTAAVTREEFNLTQLLGHIHTDTNSCKNKHQVRVSKYGRRVDIYPYGYYSYEWTV